MWGRLLTCALVGLLVGCSNTPNEKTLNDYRPQFEQLSEKPCGGEYAMVAITSLCVEATKKKIDLSSEVDPLLRNMPTSENVASALRQTSAIRVAAEEWTRNECDDKAGPSTCSSPGVDVETYFSALRSLVEEIA